jgi:hypothetical protein
MEKNQPALPAGKHLSCNSTPMRRLSHHFKGESSTCRTDNTLRVARGTVAFIVQVVTEPEKP